MKKFFVHAFIVLIFAVVVTSCSSSNIVTNSKETEKTENTYPKSGIVGEMLEQARQQYVQALAKTETGTSANVVILYESSLRIINTLSYYLGTDQNEAYIDLEFSIMED